VSNVLRFASEILKNGRASLFDQKTVELFAECQGPEGSSRALGWDTPSDKSSSGQLFSPHSIGHLGFSGCSLWIDLEANIGVVLLSNRTWPDRKSQLIREVRPAFHDAVRKALQ
jgi:CubicO group peptidase (beta-lactamase class C family)